MNAPQTDKPDSSPAQGCDAKPPGKRSLFACCCSSPAPEDENDAAIARSRRSSRYITWIASLMFYLLVLLVIGQDFTHHVKLNYRIQTQGQHGNGEVIFNEPYIVNRGSTRVHKGYHLKIQGDHGLLDFISPLNPPVGSQVEYRHLTPGMHTRVIDPAKPSQNLIYRDLLSWTGLLQMAGMALLAFLILITIRRIILALTGKLPA